MNWTSVTEIKHEQFKACKKKKIKSITIPNTVVKIGNSAFQHFHSLESITIPNSITILPPKTFFYCRNLTHVKLPNSLTAIGDEAFHNCVRLTSIDIPPFVNKIGRSAFYCNKVLLSITIPDGITQIKSDTFADCSSLRSVIIPSSVTEIEPYAFAFCRSLYYAYVPSSIQAMGEGAFLGCWSLRCIALPSHLRNDLKGDVFENCEALLSRPHDDDDDYNSTEEWLMKRFENLQMHQACYDPNVTMESLSCLINNDFGFDINTRGSFNDDNQLPKDAMNMTPLHILCCNPNATPEMIRMLKMAYSQDLERTCNGTCNVSAPLEMYLMSKAILSQKELEITPLDNFTEWSHQRHALRTEIMTVMGNDSYNTYSNRHLQIVDLLKIGLKADIVVGLLEFLNHKQYDLSSIISAASLPQCGLDVLYLLALKQPNMLLKSEKKVD